MGVLRPVSYDSSLIAIGRRTYLSPELNASPFIVLCSMFLEGGSKHFAYQAELLLINKRVIWEQSHRRREIFEERPSSFVYNVEAHYLESGFEWSWLLHGTLKESCGCYKRPVVCHSGGPPPPNRCNITPQKLTAHPISQRVMASASGQISLGVTWNILYRCPTQLLFLPIFPQNAFQRGNPLLRSRSSAAANPRPRSRFYCPPQLQKPRHWPL